MGTRTWSRFGWCSFAKGLFWLTDPNHYASRILDWTEGFDPDDGDPWILFARTAFGEMFCDQATSAKTLQIGTPHGSALTQRKIRKGLESSMQAFFLGRQKADCDFYSYKEELLFDSALKNLGQLRATEVYGFKHLLTQGGRTLQENLIKYDFLEYLDAVLKSKKPVLRLN